MKSLTLFRIHVSAVRATIGTASTSAPRPFQLHWTSDNWEHANDTIATPTALGVHFVDIPLDRGQRAPIAFTFLWKDSGAWDGRVYAVAIV